MISIKLKVDLGEYFCTYLYAVTSFENKHLKCICVSLIITSLTSTPATLPVLDHPFSLSGASNLPLFEQIKH